MSKKHQPVIVGEVLFDLFDNNQSILGGAPFNVAWHLQGFGQAPFFISRVGQDSYGENIMQTMQDWGMDTSGIQLDTQYPTGLVKVELKNGQPSFDICNDVAYDFINISQADQVLSMPVIPILYHGSLAARGIESYDAILQLRQASETSFVDINLRAPWWKHETIKKLIHGAGWLKLNDDELIQITSCSTELPDMLNAARQLMQEHNIDVFVLTRGSEGGLIIENDNVIQIDPVKLDSVVDTVGAGDAFSAVCMLGMLQHWDATTILKRASAFAGKICQQQGATSIDREMYETCKEQWQLN